MRLRPAIAIATPVIALCTLYPAISFFSPDTHSAVDIAEAAGAKPEVVAMADAVPAAPLTLAPEAPPEPAATAPETVAEVLPAQPAAAPEAEPEPQTRVLTVDRGDTLMRLLSSAGVDAADAHAAIASLSEHFRPATLRAGDEIAIRLSADETPL